MFSLFIHSFLLYMYGDRSEGHGGGGNGSAEGAPSEHAATPAVAGMPMVWCTSDHI
jgi:hypothetical protein